VAASSIDLVYLLASILFIVCFMELAHPRTAVRGNLLGAAGMLLAVLVTLREPAIVGRGRAIWPVVAGGVAVGAIIGATLALKVRMTAMPQMVALLNGFGGGASVLVAGAAFHDAVDPSTTLLVATGASGVIGAVTFFGSLVAFDKLQEWLLPGRPILFHGQQPLNLVLGIVVLGLGAWIVLAPGATWIYWALVGAASVLGVLLTIPIGGADMPVAIALLNSYSGLAGAATGFVLGNEMLIIAGSLVGASGVILALIMCRAMNRSLANVLLGRIAGGTATVAGADLYAGKVTSATAEEIALLFDVARRVVIVPGYGMAISQAQHAVRDLANLLESKGIEVEFAIHPVAGRMPGHMNVLLAEADVPYDKLKELDEINPTFEATDVAIVIGANDVVNPLARTDPGSPIAGMPILNVDKARTVVVIKRSLSPGFAGIPNPLFAADNTLMYFSDGKRAVLDLIAALKAA
jgi:proton-translocating NAD(P)+ transhydrogenase subunit beta